jgi:hypothetical protein
LKDPLLDNYHQKVNEISQQLDLLATDCVIQYLLNDNGMGAVGEADDFEEDEQ